MKKSALMRKVAAETGVPYATVKRVMDAAIADIINSLKSGERVVLSGFGTFALRPYRARQWINPQTGREIDIPAALRPGFVSSAALKRQLAGVTSDGVEADDEAEKPAKRSRRARRTASRE